MAKLEQKARKGLYGGFKPGSTGGPGTGKFKNTVKRKANNLKRAVGDVASNVKEKIKSSKTTEKTPLTINTSDSSNTTIGYDPSSSPSDRYSQMISLNQPIANPNAYTANLAGGSRPMTAMDNPQVDPITGMPITPGGQPNMNPNFIGSMANSNMPTTGMLAQEKSVYENLKEFGGRVMDDIKKADSTLSNMVDKAALKVGILDEKEYARRIYDFNKRNKAPKTPQEKYDAAKADLNNNGVTEDWEKAKAEKFTVAQEKKMMRTMRPLEKLKPSETYSSYKDFRGNMQKATIDDSTFTSDSTNFKSGINPKYKLDMNMSYNYNKENNPKAVEFSERMTPEINQSRRSTKCMRVKKK